MSLADSIRSAKRVYIIGNGGSAANAIHIANDLLSEGIRAHALTADISTITALANDFGYENVFSAQIAIYGEAGDLLIALSGSGKSPNILRAIETADAIGMDVERIFGNGLTMQEAEQEQLRLGHEAMLWLRSHKQ